MAKRRRETDNTMARRRRETDNTMAKRRRERQHNGQKTEGDKQHNGQKTEGDRQHNGQKKKDKQDSTKHTHTIYKKKNNVREIVLTAILWWMIDEYTSTYRHLALLVIS